MANQLFDLDASIRVSDQDTYDFIESKRNAATKNKTKSDVGRFVEWLELENEHRDIDVQPNE